MQESNFSTARQLAQELVRSRVEPGDVAKLVEFMQENKDGEAFFAHLRTQFPSDEAAGEDGSGTATPVRIFETHLRPLQDKPEEMIDILGWSFDFMRYYRGEGNRPSPERRVSQPRRQRPPRQHREQRAPSLSMETLQMGQALQGKIRSVMPYGAFVDIGAERDGLIHISEMTDEVRRDPAESLTVGESVSVWVKGVDMEKKRISLTMRDPAQEIVREPVREPVRETVREPMREPSREPFRENRRDSYDRPSREREGRQEGAPRGFQRNEPRTAPQRGQYMEQAAPQAAASAGPDRPERRRGSPRRRDRDEARYSSDTRLFEDETPKEMTALGEALRAALAMQESDGGESEEESNTSRKRKQNTRPEELAEAHRRTLRG